MAGPGNSFFLCSVTPGRHFWRLEGGTAFLGWPWCLWSFLAGQVPAIEDRALEIEVTLDPNICGCLCCSGWEAVCLPPLGLPAELSTLIVLTSPDCQGLAAITTGTPAG